MYDRPDTAPPHPSTMRRSCAAHLASILAIAVALALGPTSQASTDPEMRFCAPLNAWPAADRERGGYDVDIAQLLADELGADATFEWIRFDDVGVRDSLHAGLCDLMIGMGEGVAGTLSTVPYLRTPYVFVSHERRDLSIESLDDPLLRDLTIGTYQFGTPTIALRNRNLDDRVEFAADVTDEGVDRHAPILEAVLDGSVDVGIVYGPVAGARVAAGAPLTIEPVRPEIDFGESIIQHSRIWTIGVRPHDEALRDRLNAALARRWEDVRSILERHGVPMMDLSRPSEAAPIPDDVLRIGIVHPSRTPAQVPGFVVGEHARLATRIAENDLGRSPAIADSVRIYEASAPTYPSTLRAARALIENDRIDVLIGGYDDRSALGLADLGATHDVLFLNVGSARASLRNPSCFPTTVHVAPDDAAYVRAMVGSGLALDPEPERWYAVAETSYADEDAVHPLEAAVETAGATFAGSSVVDADQLVYTRTFDAIADAEPDVVVLLMDETSQERFLSQADNEEVAWAVTGLPTLASQSRTFLQRFLQVSRDLLRTPRVAAWDPALDRDVATRFAARTAESMSGAAWTTYAAFAILFDAVERQHGPEADALIDAWTTASALDVAKAEPASLRPSDRQLRSTLYLVQPTPDAQWGRTPSERTATARVVDTVPTRDAWPSAEPSTDSGPAVCPRP
ncbi:MAG: ABC transporter substrate-binding protein [Trueperaceae bacterium]|nr:ABC transporter substrate-binding protein [Trueperaceae bacterium]